jgi:glycosyltransferase involved in cell wall biosynthesis
MSQHGVFLFPSRCEGFGLVLIEAMARGLVVVSASVGVAPEVISTGETGFLVEGSDAEEYARRIEELVRSGAALGPVATAAAKVAERFTWKRSAEARESLYRDLDQRAAEGLQS